MHFYNFLNFSTHPDLFLTYHALFNDFSNAKGVLDMLHQNV